MALPTVASVTETVFNTDATAHAVSMPATVGAGDLLISIWTTDDLVATTTPTGWTLQWTADRSTFVRGNCYVIDAVGDEDGTTVDHVTASNQVGVAQVIRILAAEWFGTLSTGVESGSATNGFSSAPDPPSLTATWGQEDNLWIAMLCANDDEATVSTYPTNYGDDNTDTVTVVGADAGATVGMATRGLRTATENAGAFALSSDEGWLANTLVIRPVAADLVGPRTLMGVGL